MANTASLWSLGKASDSWMRTRQMLDGVLGMDAQLKIPSLAVPLTTRVQSPPPLTE